MNNTEETKDDSRFVNFNVEYAERPTFIHTWAKDNDIQMRIFMDVDGAGLNGFVYEFKTRVSAELFIKEIAGCRQQSFWAEDASGAIHHLISNVSEARLKCPELCGKSWFLADLKICEEYLKELDLKPACDASVYSIIIRRILDYKQLTEVAYNLDILSRVPVIGLNAIDRSTEIDPSYVWISCGTSLGLTLYQPQSISAMKPKNIVGVASASAFNAGYAGLKLHERDGNSLGRVIRGFYGGNMVH